MANKKPNKKTNNSIKKVKSVKKVRNTKKEEIIDDIVLNDWNDETTPLTEVKEEVIEDVQEEEIVDEKEEKAPNNVEEKIYKTLDSIFSNFNSNRISVKPFFTNQLHPIYNYFGKDLTCMSCGEQIIQMYKYLNTKYIELKNNR